MKRIIPLIAVVFTVVLTFTFCRHEPLVQPDQPNQPTNVKDSVCFEEEILPLLASGCAKSGCHESETQQSGIILDSYENVKATISGDLLLQVIRDSGVYAMPPAPNEKFTTAQIQLIQDWIHQGMKRDIDCEGPCDSVNVTFSRTIYPLLQNNCTGCHSNSDDISLIGYSNVKAQVNNGKLNGSVNHLRGYRAMPEGQPKLSDCKLAQIRKWISAGAPNN